MLTDVGLYIAAIRGVKPHDVSGSVSFPLLFIFWFVEGDFV